MVAKKEQKKKRQKQPGKNLFNKMALQKLKLESTFYHEDVVIFGLVSTLPAYRLAYFINQGLDLSLQRSKIDKPYHYKNTLLYYSNFEYEDVKKGVNWFLTANKNPVVYEENAESMAGEILESRIVSGLPLVSSLKIIDFFIGYYGEENSSLNKNINHQLKVLSYVSTFQKIDLEKTRNIDNLLIT